MSKFMFAILKYIAENILRLMHYIYLNINKIIKNYQKNFINICKIAYLICSCYCI